jgi:hypothetical protein
VPAQALPGGLAQGLAHAQGQAEGGGGMTARRRGQIDLFTKRVRQVPAAPEFSMQAMLADILSKWMSRDWRYTHIPLGEYRADATAARLKRMGVIAGWPDFILLSPKPRSLAHFLELKRRGGTLSDSQELFAAYCTEHGYPFACVDRFDDAVNILKQWGALRVSVQV